jgi:hypothetical protein
MTTAILASPVESTEERPVDPVQLGSARHAKPTTPLVFVCTLLTFVVWFFQGFAQWERDHDVSLKRGIVLSLAMVTFGMVFGLWLAGAR